MINVQSIAEAAGKIIRCSGITRKWSP